MRVLLLALVAATLHAAPAAARELRVMTFNVRVPVESDGPNRWEARRDLFVKTIRRADPDVIGTQELKQEQGDYVVAHLPHWRWFGRDRLGGHADEHMGVFYRTDRLRLIAQGDFQLSDTPDVPGSVTWAHPYPRMVTWGTFEAKDGSRFTLYNTHLPYRPEDDAAREKGARMIAERLAALPGTVILTGDFNTAPDTRTHAILAATLTDVRDAAPRRKGPEATFHNFTGTPDRRIDWILERGATPVSVTTITDARDGRYPSDHFPVLATLRLPQP